MEKTYTLKIGEDNLVFKTGKVAKQANAAVVAVHGETTVLTTACMSDKPREGLGFFPLLVDFEERYYAAGKIPGGYIKREGRPSQKAILSARVIDRSIRSLFDENMRNDVHVVATVLSVDQEHPSSILGINAASLALTISDIPWSGPVGAVRMGCIDGRLVVNPAEGQMENSTLDLNVIAENFVVAHFQFCRSQAFPLSRRKLFKPAIAAVAQRSPLIQFGIEAGGGQRS